MRHYTITCSEIAEDGATIGLTWGVNATTWRKVAALLVERFGEAPMQQAFSPEAMAFAADSIPRAEISS